MIRKQTLQQSNDQQKTDITPKQFFQYFKKAFTNRINLKILFHFKKIQHLFYLFLNIRMFKEKKTDDFHKYRLNLIAVHCFANQTDNYHWNWHWCDYFHHHFVLFLSRISAVVVIDENVAGLSMNSGIGFFGRAKIEFRLDDIKVGFAREKDTTMIPASIKFMLWTSCSTTVCSTCSYWRSSDDSRYTFT
ncbi:hypothetical protein RFI_29534 [Reticulomyxa filosa]|uniref:Uncharacterized protein n=1 Tax=Reticulomyxa filosa TaxID=46433 RepID=X6M316_RETFI|nr:hypothetical protein RFI_29534 [Reticulomyxa filosa]|eukprot:ETO07857.1 hypothetical protein RFI_29534 [Reticulomyxa filosa]